MTLLFLGFLGVSVLVIATPGPETALTVRNTLLGGRRGGALTAAGVGLAWPFASKRRGRCAGYTNFAGLRLSSGPVKRPRQSEDGDLLLEPAAAIRRRGHLRKVLLRDDRLIAQG